MVRYTLKQLRYFVETAECGSVAEAGSRLRISQPSVSAAIRKLEAEFGVQLFIRHHARGVSLTPAGRRLLVEARHLLRHAQEMQQVAQAAGGAVNGELELGCFVTFAPLFMPRLLTAFTERYPEVEIRLHEGVQTELVAGLESGRFELAMLYDLELSNKIEIEFMASGDPYVLLPTGHRLASRKRISLEQLKDEPLILLDVPPSRTYFTGLFHSAGVEPTIAFSSPSFELVRGLVGRGRGYSLLVTRPYGDYTYDGQKLVTRPIAEPVQPSKICLARLRRVRPTKLMQTFSGFCREFFRGRRDRSCDPRTRDTAASYRAAANRRRRSRCPRRSTCP